MNPSVDLRKTTKKVLALSGGGMRGVILAQFLELIERDSKKRVQDIFDLVAGTSTGAITAATLGAPDPMPASELKKFYYESGPKIFRKVLGGIWNNGLFAPKYRDEPLNTELQKSIGLYTLDQSPIKLLIPTYESTKRDAVFIKSWDSYWHGFPAWKAARCSASAETYFPPYVVGDNRYIDGGTFCNCPSASASFEAFRLWPSNPLSVLLIGTGKVQNPRPLPTGGALGWAAQIFGAFSEGQDDMCEYMCNGLVEPGYKYDRLDVYMDTVPGMDDASTKTLDQYCDLAKKKWDERGASILDAIQ